MRNLPQLDGNSDGTGRSTPSAAITSWWWKAFSTLFTSKGSFPAPIVPGVALSDSAKVPHSKAVARTPWAAWNVVYHLERCRKTIPECKLSYAPRSEHSGLSGFWWEGGPFRWTRWRESVRESGVCLMDILQIQFKSVFSNYNYKYYYYNYIKNKIIHKTNRS